MIGNVWALGLLFKAYLDVLAGEFSYLYFLDPKECNFAKSTGATARKQTDTRLDSQSAGSHGIAKSLSRSTEACQNDIRLGIVV